MSAEYTFERHIKVPRSRVFDAIVEVEQAREWMPDLVSIERVSGPENEVGDKRAETRKMYGREATEYIEITDMKRPGRLNFFTDGSEGSTGRGEFYFTYWLEEAGPDGGETKLTLECRIEEMGWFGSLMLTLFSGSFTKSMENDIDHLANYLERDAEAAA